MKRPKIWRLTLRHTPGRQGTPYLVRKRKTGPIPQDPKNPIRGRVTIAMPQDMIDELTAMATQHGMSRSGFARLLIQEGMQRRGIRDA